jgi:hypothetical protein
LAHRLLRTTLLFLEGFLSLTAVAGGIGLLTGMLSPPVEDLAGSIFTSYKIPGAALAAIVGGSALAGTFLLALDHRYAPMVTAASGLAIIGFESVEVLVIGSPAGLARNMQAFYFGLGFLILAVSAGPLVAMRRRLAQL